MFPPKLSFLINVCTIFCFSKSKLPENSVTLLYQIMDGSGHLDLGEIEAAVSDCIHDKDTRCAMIEAIKEFKESNLNLAVAKRYPVLLILDEVSKENSLFLLKSFLFL